MRGFFRLNHHTTTTEPGHTKKQAAGRRTGAEILIVNKKLGINLRWSVTGQFENVLIKNKYKFDFVYFCLCSYVSKVLFLVVWCPEGIPGAGVRCVGVSEQKSGGADDEADGSSPTHPHKCAGGGRTKSNIMISGPVDGSRAHKTSRTTFFHCTWSSACCCRNDWIVRWYSVRFSSERSVSTDSLPDILSWKSSTSFAYSPENHAHRDLPPRYDRSICSCQNDNGAELAKRYDWLSKGTEMTELGIDSSSGSLEILC